VFWIHVMKLREKVNCGRLTHTSISRNQFDFMVIMCLTAEETQQKIIPDSCRTSDAVLNFG